MRLVLLFLMASVVSACASLPAQVPNVQPEAAAGSARTPAGSLSVSSATMPAFQCHVDGGVIRYVTVNAKDAETAVTVAQAIAATEDNRIRQRNFKHPPATVEAVGLRALCKKIE